MEDAPLLSAVAFLQDLLRQDKSPRHVKPSTFPTAVIPKGLQRYLFDATDGRRKDKHLDIDRYEFLVYRLLRNALEAGDVYVPDSTEFRRFEDDLISDTRWQDKDTVLREIGAPRASWRRSKKPWPLSVRRWRPNSRWSISALTAATTTTSRSAAPRKSAAGP